MMLRKFGENVVTETNKLGDLIRANDSAKLKDELDSFSNVTLDKILNGLLLAVNIDNWACVPEMIKYAQRIKAHSDDKSIRIFSAELGRVLLIAVRKNHEDTVKALFSFDPYYPRTIFYTYKDAKYKKRDFLLQDSYNLYSFLHLAVKNNNPDMCELLLRRWNAYVISCLEKNTHETVVDDSDATLLCTVHNQQGQTAFGMAMSLNYINCAIRIAKYHKWSLVFSTEDPDTIYKTLVNNICFGFTGLYDVYYSKLSYSIPACNRYERTEFSNNENRLDNYNIMLTKPDSEKRLFLNQTLNPETALGYLFAANNPNEGLTFKERIKKELSRLNPLADENNEQITEDNEPSLSSSHSDSDSENDFPNIEDTVEFSDYSVHLRAYLSKFSDDNKISEQIKKLCLTPDEGPLFEKFIDPITEEYIGIPVSLNERYYDFETIRHHPKDPFTNERFEPNEIQSARCIQDKLDAAVIKLTNFRDALAEKNQLPLVSVGNFGIFTPNEKSGASEIKQNKDSFEFRWD